MCRHVIQNAGVVRGITNWGPFSLPRMGVRANQATHSVGHYFVIRFDSSPKVQDDIRKMMKIDPRVIRCGLVKIKPTKKTGYINTERGTVPWK
jgi:small subunit ribosomal protein S6